MYKLLYVAVSMGLTEESATDWEGCKPMISNSEVGAMVLGSWTIIQMQEPVPTPPTVA